MALGLRRWAMQVQSWSSTWFSDYLAHEASLHCSRLPYQAPCLQGHSTQTVTDTLTPNSDSLDPPPSCSRPGLPAALRLPALQLPWPQLRGRPSPPGWPAASAHVQGQHNRLDARNDRHHHKTTRHTDSPAHEHNFEDKLEWVLCSDRFSHATSKAATATRLP